MHAGPHQEIGTVIEPLPASVLPDGVRARRVAGVNGLDMHVLEAGEPGRPVLALLHGFPELAYSWRDVMVPLAAAGYHVLAPDQRGYGRTTGWNADFDAGHDSSRMLNLVRDVLGLLHALGVARVAAVIGHDFGSPVAAWCALLRPDVFEAVALMSAPFGGPPPIGDGAARAAAVDVHAALAALARPRKHYQWYYSTREANADMLGCEQGVADFLRAYFHVKSADWDGNRPRPLAAWDADSLAELPSYYIMDAGDDMAATVAPFRPDAAQAAACAWLTEAELAVYAGEYGRTGFQGGLNWYRAATSARHVPELQVFAGRSIDVPSCYIAGAADWGVYQRPGDFERMRTAACTDLRGCHLVEGAGHWVQQEQPGQVTALLRDFLAGLR